VNGFSPAVVVTAGNADPSAPLVVLLHGRGSHEGEILALASSLPDSFAYTAVRAPIDLGGGYAWFANRGIGRPVAESLRSTMDWFRVWLDAASPAGRPVVLVGFSGGAAFAGGLLLDDPQRFAAAAVLYGTLPFDAGVPVTPRRLSGIPVLIERGTADTMIPVDLYDRTAAYLTDESGAVLEAHLYPGGHGFTEQGVADLAAWLRRLGSGALATGTSSA
jgi:phospholipase/carboxylesterase